MSDLPVPPVAVVVLVAALWGAAAGALLPRAVYRFAVPAGEAWHARCPGGHPLRGWLGRARCGQCAPRGEGAGDAGSEGGTGRKADVTRGDGERTAGTSYGTGPVAPAAVTALVCAALAVATGTRPELAVWLLLAPVGVLLAVVDFRVQRLPDPLTLPFAAAALALLGVVALVPEHAGTWTTALLGALALGAGYFALFLVNPAGMGFGDVKLALGAGAVLGWYGWPTVMLGTFAGFLFGALYGGALVVARRAGRGTAIPFGPFLIAGAFAGLLIGAYTA
ncbi:A24 family peptidase [Streptomyces hirsutus]|uniref:A24 family peptidase n=1 Tax=Streptomyces hirsutus TaxID=35620 RepID=A0ABZ1GU32_9ACTN|nr:A24 family peptidase [Streptomyces hirsutus]WSD08243.1 A24 family peptidase [Streptomyces hirsutus]WTD18297.1 A24 family peptidase [Streptomyces hirsutus]